MRQLRRCAPLTCGMTRQGSATSFPYYPHIAAGYDGFSFNYSVSQPPPALSRPHGGTRPPKPDQNLTMIGSPLRQTSASSGATATTTIMATFIQEPQPVYIQPGSHPSDCSNQRTRNQFRPRAGGKGGNTSYQLRQYAEATLGGGSLRKVVKLPEGEDENEWLAVNSMAPPRSLWCGGMRADGCFAQSGGFLQPDQPPLRSHHRVLFAPVVSGDESNRRVSIRERANSRYNT
jgi:hypothetical protein